MYAFFLQKSKNLNIEFSFILSHTISKSSTIRSNIDKNNTLMVLFFITLTINLYKSLYVCRGGSCE